MTPVSMLERDDTRKGARRAIDPLLVRLGAVAVVTTLLVPLMIGLTSGEDGDGDTVASGSTIPAPALVGPAADVPTVPDAPLDPELLPPAVPVNPPASGETGEPSNSSAEASGTSTTETADDAIEVASGEATTSGSAEASASTTSTQSAVDSPASAGDDAERITNCAIDYEVQPGDYWLRLAEGADVPLAEILEANGATSSTPLYPGTTICLPAGASTPAPPPADHRRADHDRRSDDDRCADDHRRADDHRCADHDRSSDHDGYVIAGRPRGRQADHPRRLARRARGASTRDRLPREQVRADRQELLLLRPLPDLLERPQELARRHRDHQRSTAVRPRDECSGRLRPVPACGRLGSLGADRVLNRFFGGGRSDPQRNRLDCRSPSGASARSSMDRALDYGSSGWEFDSLRARRRDPPPMRGIVWFSAPIWHPGHRRAKNSEKKSLMYTLTPADSRS